MRHHGCSTVKALILDEFYKRSSTEDVHLICQRRFAVRTLRLRKDFRQTMSSDTGEMDWGFTGTHYTLKGDPEVDS